MLKQSNQKERRTSILGGTVCTELVHDYGFPLSSHDSVAVLGIGLSLSKNSKPGQPLGVIDKNQSSLEPQS